jgi:hypothetical protein
MRKGSLTLLAEHLLPRSNPQETGGGVSLSITADSCGIRRSRVVTAAAEAAHASTDRRVFLAVQKTALLNTSEEAVLGVSTAVHGRSALRPVAVETRPNVRSEPYFVRAEASFRRAELTAKSALSSSWRPGEGAGTGIA